MVRRSWLVLALLLSSCSTATVSTTPAPSHSAPAAAPVMPDSIHWFRNSAEYRADMFQTYRLAARRLEEVSTTLGGVAWAVSVDADETLIDNSTYQKELAESGKPHSKEAWAAWVRRKEAKDLPGAAAFLKRVHELGGRVAVVTNRAQSLCADTEADLDKYGLVHDVVLCAPEQGSTEKEPRWQQVEQGTTPQGLPPLRLVMWVGDNIQDFPDLDQKINQGDADAFGDFGVKYFVLPNPMYGSWAANPRQ